MINLLLLGLLTFDKWKAQQQMVWVGEFNVPGVLYFGPFMHHNRAFFEGKRLLMTRISRKIGPNSQKLSAR